MLTTLGGDVYALDTPVWHLLKRTIVRRAAAVTVMNAEMSQRIRALGVPASRVHVLPMGQDAERLTRLGVGVQAVPGRILFGGRLVEKKGLEVLLDALAELPPELVWSLDVVGDGPLRAPLEAKARDLPRPVRFLGQQSADALARMWHECEIAAFPSVPARSGDQDGLPVALLEAMTARRAIVASRIAGIDEAIHHGEHGMLVPPGQPDQLARAIKLLITDAPLRDRLGRAAAARAKQYSMQSVSQHYIDLLRAQL